MNKLNTVIKQFEDLINVIEKNEVYKSIISEIPSNIIGLFPANSHMRYKSIYADMRLNGNTKEKSLETANRMILRTIRKSDSLTPLFIEMQKSLLRIHTRLKKGEFFQDSENMEYEDLREEIPVIENYNDFDNTVKKGGKPVGTVSHRRDGDYKKQSDGSWQKIIEPKEETSESNKKEINTPEEAKKELQNIVSEYKDDIRSIKIDDNIITVNLKRPGDASLGGHLSVGGRQTMSGQEYEAREKRNKKISSDIAEKIKNSGFDIEDVWIEENQIGFISDKFIE